MQMFLVSQLQYLNLPVHNVETHESADFISKEANLLHYTVICVIEQFRC